MAKQTSGEYGCTTRSSDADSFFWDFWFASREIGGDFHRILAVNTVPRCALASVHIWKMYIASNRIKLSPIDRVIVQISSEKSMSATFSSSMQAHFTLLINMENWMRIEIEQNIVLKAENQTKTSAKNKWRRKLSGRDGHQLHRINTI